MALYYTVDDLVANAKLRAFLPNSNTSTTSLKDDDILRLANDELWTAMTPRIQASVQEYFVVEYQFPITPPQVAFDLPPRATGGQLRDVYIVPAGGTVFQRRRIPRIAPEQIQSYSANTQALSYANGPNGFWVQGNQVVLYPFTQAADTLILSTFFRPNQMVLTSTCCVIQSVNYSSGDVTLTAAVPATYSANVLCDFVRAVPGFDPLIFDIAITSTAVNTLTFPPAQLQTQQSRIAAGDFISLAGTACVPQIPQTLHPVLAARTALRIARAIGDKENGAVLAQDVGDMEAQMYQMLQPRVEGKIETVIPSNDLIGTSRPKWFVGSF